MNRRFLSELNDSSGNVFFFILLAIALIGIVTAALRMSGQEGANIDREALAVQASQIKQYAGELERAVAIIMQNGAGESDIRFAHPSAPADYGVITATPSFQVFAREGGGAAYRAPVSGVNDGSPWEFSGQTRLPQAGSTKADLVAVLPNVTSAFCTKINEMNGLTAQPTDSGGGAGTADCIFGPATARFSGTTQYAAVPNQTDEGSFTTLPALDGCLRCSADNSLHYFHVLLAR